jgi:60 kDa SS-A/Ro ribonucleoprotein
MSKMKKITSKKDQYKTADVVNKAGFKAWSMSSEEKLVQLLHTGTIENSFYASQKEIAEGAIDVFESAPVELMEKWIPIGRNKGFMRTSPILAMTILFERDVAAAQRIFNQVINTGNDLTAFIDARRARGFGFGRGIKKSINGWLNVKLNEFYSIKYGDDVVHGIRLARPTRKEIGEMSATCADYLMAKQKGEKFTIPEAFIKLQAFEDLKALKQRGKATIEEIDALVKRGRLDYTVVTGMGFKFDAEMWKTVAKQMGVFALLRHLKTFERNGLQDDLEFVEWLFGEKITADALTNAKVFPFRVWQAWMAVTTDTFKDKLGEVMDGFIPKSDLSEWGKVCICPDTSGSMSTIIGQWESRRMGKEAPRTTMRYIDIAAMFAGVLYKGIEGSKVIAFDTQVHTDFPSRTSGVLEIVKAVEGYGGGGTYMESPLQYLMGDTSVTRDRYARRASRYSTHAKPVAKTPEKFDTFIFITDSEEWGTGLLNEWIKYKKFHPKAKLVLIRIDSYNTKPFSDEHQKKYDITQVFGWSNSVIDYIKYKLGAE